MGKCSLSAWVILFAASAAPAADPFKVVVTRGETKDGLIVGKLSVNGEAVGTVYERADKHVPAGTYKAHLRYESGKNHVQGPGGVLSKKGDFLIELDTFTTGGKKWEFIQFHAGNKPDHSDGCILCGPATTDEKTKEKIAPETLKKFRLKFYGADKPNSTPDREITVEFVAS